MTWQGTQPELPSIVLNSHMDVVPVYADLWTHPPFAAEMDESGKIYARGAQDMKSVGTQYLGAIKALKTNGVHLKRTIHIIYVPGKKKKIRFPHFDEYLSWQSFATINLDEEIGGDKGMRAFVQSDAFRNLNVGFSLDEGIATPDETFPVFYAERSVWRINFVCHGTTGHGSLLLENTAGEKMRHLLDRMMDYRDEQAKKLKNNPEFTIGDVTTVNLTILGGGVQSNVVPSSLTAFFDCRLAIDVDHDAFENMLKTWCREAGGDIDIEFVNKRPKVQPTATNDSNPFWKAFRETLVDDLLVLCSAICFNQNVFDIRKFHNFFLQTLENSTFSISWSNR